MNQASQPPPSGGWHEISITQWQQNQQYRMERRQAGRKMNALGIALLLIEVVGTAALLAASVFLVILFPNVGEGNLFVEAMEYAVYAPVALCVPFVIAAKIGGSSLGDLVLFEKQSFSVSAFCVLFCFLFIAAGNYASGMLITAFPVIEENLSSLMGSEPQNGLELLVCVLQTAAIPAIVEEFAFRGVALGLLRPYGDKFAIFISALAFGLMHGNFVQIPFAFVLGLGLGYITVRTRSLVPAIVVHFINNACSDFLSYYEESITHWLGENYGMYLYLVWLILGLTGYLFLWLQGGKLTRYMKPYQGALSTGRRVSLLFCSWSMMIAVTVYILLAFVYAVVPL